MKIKIPEYIKTAADKYKYILPILLMGIALIVMPGGTKENADKTASPPAEDFFTDVKELEKTASEIFSKIDGVGKAEVKISVRSGYEKEYISDRKERLGKNGDTVDTDTEETTVKLSSGSTETPLLKRIKYPEYLGAVIVCEGGDDSRIIYQLTQAMRSLTGISSENIVVAKMKK